MTRTERAMFPRAIIKDRYRVFHMSYIVYNLFLFVFFRSESKSGLDKSLRKAGGGPHNWGSLRDELRNETAALDDEFTEEEILRAAEMEEQMDAEMFRKYGLGTFIVFSFM